jgi:plastocyanin
MRPVRFATALATILVVAACTTSAPGWPVAPVPSATPLPSVAPSGSATASAAPSGAAPSGSAAASAAPTDATGGTTLKLGAAQVAFDQQTLAAPANAPFQIEFSNNDPSVPHDVTINDSAGARVFHGETFPGVATRTYEVPALPAGQYTFFCSVHANMTGTLTAG